MTVPVYPTALPGVETFDGQPLAQFIMTEGDDGSTPMTYRRRSRQRVTKVTVGWTFLQNDYQIFMNWYQNVLLYGHRWFWMQMPSAGGMSWVLVKFESPPDGKMQAFTHWAVTAALEMQDRSLTAQPRELIVDVDAIKNGGTVYTVGSLITDLDPARVYTLALSKKNGYTAWSNFPTDVGHATPWNSFLQINSGDGVTHWSYGSSAQVDEPTAFSTFGAGHTITGYDSYYFWVQDPGATDNRGGLSVLLS